MLVEQTRPKTRSVQCTACSFVEAIFEERLVSELSAISHHRDSVVLIQFLGESILDPHQRRSAFVVLRGPTHHGLHCLKPEHWIRRFRFSKPISRWRLGPGQHPRLGPLAGGQALEQGLRFKNDRWLAHCFLLHLLRRHGRDSRRTIMIICVQK